MLIMLIIEQLEDERGMSSPTHALYARKWADVSPNYWEAMLEFTQN
jgi:hypothetical protein